MSGKQRARPPSCLLLHLPSNYCKSSPWWREVSVKMRNTPGFSQDKRSDTCFEVMRVYEKNQCADNSVCACAFGSQCCRVLTSWRWASVSCMSPWWGWGLPVCCRRGRIRWCWWARHRLSASGTGRPSLRPQSVGGTKTQVGGDAREKRLEGKQRSIQIKKRRSHKDKKKKSHSATL